MKKILLGFAASALLATPVLACPGMNHDETAAPKTAEKQKQEPAKKDDAKPADKAKDTDQKPAADTAKKAPEKKPGDKVSAR